MRCFRWPQTETQSLHCCIITSLLHHHFTAAKFGVAFCFNQCMFQQRHATRGGEIHHVYQSFSYKFSSSNRFSAILHFEKKNTGFSLELPRFHPKKAFYKAFGNLKKIKQYYHKSGDQMAPRTHNSHTSSHQKDSLKISQPFVFQDQVTSQEPKLRYNQVDTPAMTKRKRCHSVAFIVRLGPSAPFTNHKSSRNFRSFFALFFL